MLEKFYDLFHDKKDSSLNILKKSSRTAIIDLVVADPISLPNNTSLFSKEVYEQSTDQIRWLKSDLYDSSNTNTYKAICAAYNDENNALDFMNFYSKKMLPNIDKKKVLNKLIEKCQKEKFYFIKDENGNPLYKDPQHLPQFLIEILKTNCELEYVLYILFRYAITRQYPQKYNNDKFRSYVRDSENYHLSQINNLLDGNINKKGVLNHLAYKEENTVAMFDIATSLLFGNGPKKEKNQLEALRIYKKILELNNEMPLANWGVAYILFNYPDIYMEFHQEKASSNFILSDEERYKEVHDYANKAANYGCGAAFNLLGCLYDKTGDEFIDEFKDKSSGYYYEMSYKYGYFFSLNNLGKYEMDQAKISEGKDKINHKLKAFEYYKECADSINEPYACNEVGRFLSGQHKALEKLFNLNDALKYWENAITFDDTDYYGFWPRYNYVYFSLKAFSEGKLSSLNYDNIHSCYNYLINNKDRYIFEYKKGDNNATEIKDHDGHKCYTEFLKKIEVIILNDNFSEQDKSTILNLVKSQK